jgi:hypothetical protein
VWRKKLQRREFIKTAATALAATKLATGHAFSQEHERQTRIVLSINRNWRYQPAKVDGAHLPSFNDAAF